MCLGSALVAQRKDLASFWLMWTNQDFKDQLLNACCDPITLLSSGRHPSAPEHFWNSVRFYGLIGKGTGQVLHSPRGSVLSRPGTLPSESSSEAGHNFLSYFLIVVSWLWTWEKTDPHQHFPLKVRQAEFFIKLSLIIFFASCRRCMELYVMQ